MLKDEKVFKSRDFYTCCALRASNLVLRAVEPTSGKFANFVFENPQGEAEEIIRKHWSGELKVSTKDFVAAINELKTRLNSGL